MGIVEEAVAAAISVEMKKHAYRQTQDGVVISFVMHPGDVAAALATASLGTRYMVALVEIGDDETPVSHRQKAPVEEPAADKRKWGELPLSQQAAIRCGEKAFRLFAKERFGGAAIEAHAANAVRDFCEVTSRREIVAGTSAGDKWVSLEADYQFWLKHPEVA